MQKENKVYNVVSSGSHGNCEIYHKSIVVDIGVSFKAIEPYLNDIQVIFISHKHGDHFNLSTIKKIQSVRPSVRVMVGKWMFDLLKGVDNIDVLELNEWYNYGAFKVSIGKLFHDVPNAFIRIEKDGYKIFRATDTSHLQGITAKNYDLYACEQNYNEETIHDSIAKIEASGGFAHQKGSINTHLSIQQAQQFIFDNRKESSEVIRLHESKSN